MLCTRLPTFGAAAADGTHATSALIAASATALTAGKNPMTQSPLRPSIRRWRLRLKTGHDLDELAA
ncbi:hypothetical protein MSM1_21005 [Mycobacterium sp. SM1]|uniref:hypothetical protein n=1 Tax=Mycobacterium sp. SM1 TaxID=2816243 RepID=UPI001BCABAEC|nr:hypothetical protein [Mycobacterium sp. SM1]MBS4730685.1 hypothetical protein [Mycobacterium sp. SM1]